MPFVIPYFISHQGCPHRCLFCNQHSITGREFTPGDVGRDIEETIEKWLGYTNDHLDTQLAFYGGSFTCLDQDLQSAMLEAAVPWRKSGRIASIRLSTRPDCIDDNRSALLQNYGVATVELGVQSLDNSVLAAAQRGHNEEDCMRAVANLHKAGIEVGIQLMPGLPRETRASFLQTVRKAIALRPAFVRLYPTLVVAETALASLYKKGKYTPLSLGMAVLLVMHGRRKFLDAGIRVVRMGLQHSDSLQQAVIAGPYHPAFGELVRSREWLGRLRRLIAQYPGKKLRLTISEKDLSSCNGLGNANRKRLSDLGLEECFEVVVDKNMEREQMNYVVC